MGELFTGLMRRLFGLLDKIVIFLIETLYNLIMMIADTNVLGDLVYHYLGRIYTFLGIFMVFKLSISMINYIVNPDALTDKGKGFGKLISNVIISLILLVTTPTLFDVAFDIQSDILETNAVYQIVTGKKLINSSAASNNEKMGRQIAYGVYSTFIYKSSGNDNYDFDLSGDVTALTGSKKCDDTSNPYCLVNIDDTLLKKDDGDFANEYWYLISTICGVFVAYMLFTFCFDAAVRSIKLGFLQIIAPIPILSMLDPKKGNDQLMKWVKECGKTFADLFIRLAGLFLVVDIIGVILGTNGSINGMYLYTDPNTSQTNLFVRLFVIIGLLMFAKQMPQLLSDILGIKLDGGGFSLKKKLGDLPGSGVAKALGAGALGFAGGMAANAIGAGKTWKATDGNWLKKLGATGGSLVAGGTSAMARGMTSKDKNMFKAAGSGIKGAVDKRELRDKRQDAGYTLKDRIGDNIKSFGGVDGVAKERSDALYGSITNLQRQQAQYDRIAQEELLTKNYNENYLNQLNGIANSAKIEAETGRVYWTKKDSNGNVTKQYSDSLKNTQYGNDLKYIEAIAKSNDASIKVAKENKKLKLYQKEDKSK